MVEVKIKKLEAGADMPQQMSKGAACFDLVVNDVEFTNKDYNKVILKFGISVEIPEGYKLVIVPRSSFTHKGWVMANTPGQVDSDYRGELMVRMEAIPTGVELYEVPAPLDFPERPDITKVRLTYDDCPYFDGDKAFQAYIEKVEKCSFVEVKELTATERGEGGFGSTGK